MSNLPKPLTPPECNTRDLPVPHQMLVDLSAEAFGTTESQTVAMLESLGMVRVAGGWKMGH